MTSFTKSRCQHKRVVCPAGDDTQLRRSRRGTHTTFTMSSGSATREVSSPGVHPTSRLPVSPCPLQGCCDDPLPEDRAPVRGSRGGERKDVSGDFTTSIYSIYHLSHHHNVVSGPQAMRRGRKKAPEPCCRQKRRPCSSL